MALTFCVLGSGSTGNCLWVRGGGTSLLVDCGLSARQTARRLAESGGTLGEVLAVVCTHAHCDHVAGAPVLARRHGLEVWATDFARGLLPAGIPEDRLRSLPRDGESQVGGLRVRSLPTPHDAPGSVALLLTDGTATLAVVTDVGVPTLALLAALRTADAAVLEFNHDEAMLRDGPYPEFLKQRIRGGRGHLSNAQGAELLRRALHPGLGHLTLAHLSQENNTPDRARRAAEQALRDAPAGFGLAVAEPHQALPPVEVVTVRAPARQLRLPLR